MTKLTLSVLVITCLLFVTCNSDQEKTDASSNPSDSLSIETPGLAEFEFTSIVLNMPTPLDELSDMNNDGIQFDPELLAPLENASSHEATASIAINCAMYLVDMTYQAVFHQTEQLMAYSNTAHDLAQKIELADLFDADIKQNMEASMEDQAKLQNQIEQALEHMENYLTENDKLVNATQMLIGSWVEVQYLLTQSMVKLSEKDIAQDLKGHVFAQRNHLDNLLILIEEFKNEAGLHSEHEKLLVLEQSFQKIHESDEVNHEILVELAQEIKEIRTDLLGMN